MSPSRKLIILTLCGALVFSAFALQARERKTKDKDSVSLGTPKAPAVVSSPTGHPVLGLNLLTWDDGTFENGLGPTGGHYDGQFAMRFGGAAATSALVGFQIRGAYFRLRSGAPGITLANVNFWHPLTAGGFPAGASPIAQAPGAPVTGVTQTVTLSGPNISTANGSVLVGVGGLGTTGWFIDRDTDGPDNNREFAGESSNNTQALSLGPTTLGSLGFSGNYFIRLLVDGNIPVELEAFTVETLD